MNTKFLAFALLMCVLLAVFFETVDAKNDKEDKGKKGKKEKKQEKKCIHGCNMVMKECKKEVRSSASASALPPSASSSPVPAVSPVEGDDDDDDNEGDGSSPYARCKDARKVCKNACFAPSPSPSAVSPVV